MEGSSDIHKYAGNLSFIDSPFSGDDPAAKIHHHDSRFVVISDIAPASTHHYLVIPKEHIRDVRCLDDRHIDMLLEMRDLGRKVSSSSSNSNYKGKRKTNALFIHIHTSRCSSFKVLESRGGNWAECRRGFHWPPHFISVYVLV